MALTIGGAFNQTWRIARANFRLLLPAVAALYLPSTVVGALVYGPSGGASDVDSPAAGLALFIGSMMTSLLALILYAISQAVALVIAIDSMSDVRPTLGSAFRRGLSRAVNVVLAAILQSLALVLGFFACIIPGLLIWPALALAVPGVVAEDLGPTDSLRRSWELTKGYRGVVFVGVFGLTVLTLLVQGALSLLATGQLIVDPSNVGEVSLASWLTQQALSYANSVFFGAIGAVLIAVFYIEIKKEKEGVNVEELSAVFE